MAMRDFLSARECIAASEAGTDGMELEDGGGDAEKMGRQKLTTSHAFLANMGGFRVRLRCRQLAPGGQASLSGAEGTNDDSENLLPSQREIDSAGQKEYEGIVLNFEGLETLQRLCPDVQIPSEEDIKGLSKSDVFTKTFACVQSTWLVIQCSTRFSAGLPITQLELATIAFVVCGILMYLLWWHKPFGVDRRSLIVATTSRVIKQDDFLQKATRSSAVPGPYTVLLVDATYWKNDSHFMKERVMNPELFSHLGEDAEFFAEIGRAAWRAIKHSFGFATTPLYPSPSAGSSMAFYLSGTLFSAFHILAWNWEFPVRAVVYAWRTFAVAATSANPIVILSFMLMDAMEVHGDTMSTLSVDVLGDGDFKDEFLVT
ncbi:hypothetical protein EG329_009160 [Mollisiaceae sp. DMI_Dod_QoI]|nr:hypothetical protein EG329_009160 [Helotiales sp. DMI_Dod_QoI]